MSAFRVFFVEPIVFFRDTYKLFSSYSDSLLSEGERDSIREIEEYAKTHILSADEDWSVLAGKLHALYSRIYDEIFKCQNPCLGASVNMASLAMRAQALYEKAIKSLSGGKKLTITLDEDDDDEEVSDDEVATQPLPTEEGEKKESKEEIRFPSSQEFNLLDDDQWDMFSPFKKVARKSLSH